MNIMTAVTLGAGFCLLLVILALVVRRGRRRGCRPAVGETVLFFWRYSPVQPQIRPADARERHLAPPHR